MSIKHLHKASFFLSDKDKVKCLLCPKECLIVNGNTGVCGVRKNIDGILYSLVYSKPVAIHVDPIEKKPLFHFYPGSDILSIGTYGCNLSCQFCQNFDISQADSSKIETSGNELTPEELIKICKKNNLEFLAFTYNEPVIFFEYMLDIAKLCKNEKIKTVMVSNGQINPKPLLELIPYIDAFNIDLKSFNESFYKNICNGKLETTRNTIRTITEHKKHIEITFLLIKDFNDNLEEFTELCNFIKSLNPEIVLHISRAFPRYKLDMKTTPIELLNSFKETALRYLKNVYTGNV